LTKEGQRMRTIILLACVASSSFCVDDTSFEQPHPLVKAVQKQLFFGNQRHLLESPKVKKRVPRFLRRKRARAKFKQHKPGKTGKHAGPKSLFDVWKREMTGQD
jgi:hypothetical protein